MVDKKFDSYDHFSNFSSVSFFVVPARAWPLVEARLIHIRALLDFFQQEKRRVRKKSELDDVLSSDYGFAQCIVGIDKPYKERLNKDLAHLTYSRASRLPSDKPWPRDKVILPIFR